MASGGWWVEHVRPRDLFALLCLVILAALCSLVWIAGAGDATTRKDVIVDALGIVAGLSGFYSGARVADRAADRARDDLARLADAIAERDRALEDATALVAELRQQAATLAAIQEEG